MKLLRFLVLSLVSTVSVAYFTFAAQPQPDAQDTVIDVDMHEQDAQAPSIIIVSGPTYNATHKCYDAVVRYTDPRKGSTKVEKIRRRDNAQSWIFEDGGRQYLQIQDSSIKTLRRQVVSELDEKINSLNTSQDAGETAIDLGDVPTQPVQDEPEQEDTPLNRKRKRDDSTSGVAANQNNNQEDERPLKRLCIRAKKYALARPKTTAVVVTSAVLLTAGVAAYFISPEFKQFVDTLCLSASGFFFGSSHQTTILNQPNTTTLSQPDIQTVSQNLGQNPHDVQQVLTQNPAQVQQFAQQNPQVIVQTAQNIQNSSVLTNSSSVFNASNTPVTSNTAFTQPVPCSPTPASTPMPVQTPVPAPDQQILNQVLNSINSVNHGVNDINNHIGGLENQVGGLQNQVQAMQGQIQGLQNQQPVVVQVPVPAPAPTPTANAPQQGLYVPNWNRDVVLCVKKWLFNKMTFGSGNPCQ